jgi:hypothetical protein
MLRKTSLIALIGLSIAAVSAQENQSSNTDVIWAEAATCSELNTAEVKQHKPSCSRIEVDEKYYYVTSYMGVTTAIQWRRADDYVRVTMQISNSSGKDLSFDPLGSEIRIYNDQAAFLNGENAQKTSKYITGKQARTREKNRIISRNLSYGGSVPMQSGSNTTLDGTFIGAKQTTERGPDGSLITRSEPVARNPNMPQGIKKMNDRTKSIFENDLEVQVIANQSKVAGYVFFMPVPYNNTFKVFRIKVGEVMFVFPPNILPSKM